MISPVTSHSGVQEESHSIVQDPPQQRPDSGIEKYGTKVGMEIRCLVAISDWQQMTFLFLNTLNIAFSLAEIRMLISIFYRYVTFKPWPDITNSYRFVTYISGVLDLFFPLKNSGRALRSMA